MSGFRQRLLSTRRTALLLAMGLPAVPTRLHAEVPSSEQVVVLGDATRDARVVAPTTQPLDATQPTSVFNQHYIQTRPFAAARASGGWASRRSATTWLGVWPPSTRWRRSL